MYQNRIIKLILNNVIWATGINKREKTHNNLSSFEAFTVCTEMFTSSDCSKEKYQTLCDGCTCKQFGKPVNFVFL